MVKSFSGKGRNISANPIECNTITVYVFVIQPQYGKVMIKIVSKLPH
jgi:hypothetical protein